MTPTFPTSPAQGEPAGVSDKRLAEIARVATNELHFHEKDSTVGVSTTALLSICNELCRARQKLAEMRGAFDEAVAAELPSANLVGKEAHEICKRFAVELRKALAPTSQPSRGKKLSLSEAVEAARGHADPVRDLSAMRADCAQQSKEF